MVYVRTKRTHQAASNGKAETVKHWTERIDSLESDERYAIAEELQAKIASGFGEYSRAIGYYKLLVPSPTLWRKISAHMKEVTTLTDDWTRLPVNK